MTKAKKYFVFLGLVLLALGPRASLASEYKAIGVGKAHAPGISSHCSAFVVRNRPNRDDDLVVTAAHCLHTTPKGTPKASPLITEWGGKLTPVVFGEPNSPTDIAVLRGSVPERYKELPVRLVEPPYPYEAYNLRRGLSKEKKVRIEGPEIDGSLRGVGYIIGGDSGGPLMWRDEKGKEWVVGVVFAMTTIKVTPTYDCWFVGTSTMVAAIRRATALLQKSGP